MAILGAHMSIAGGCYKAIDSGHAVGCQCVQLFTKNNNQWRAKELTVDDVARFRQSLEACEIEHTLVHNSYLINLASPDEELWRKSLDAYIVELQRAEQLGIPYLVMHPGSYTSSSEEAGLRRVVEALDEIHRQLPGLKVMTLLETTAGQGTNLGHRFEHLATILAGVAAPERVAVCVDTCHVFAAGYPISTEADYQQTFKAIDTTFGIGQIRAFHLNDSQKGLGSRVDRHAHIGEGAIGLEGFRLLLADDRFTQIPMYLETPKGDRDGEELDVINLRTLRGLIA